MAVRIAAATRALPKGGVKSFRNATRALVLIVCVHIHFEAAKFSAVVASAASSSASKTGTTGKSSEIVRLEGRDDKP